MKKENSWIFADFVYSDGLELSLNTSCYANELPAAVENPCTGVKPDESVTRKLSRPLSQLNALWWGF